jgi:hypothetical protein
LIDALLGELYELLFLGPDGPLLGSRMLLKPDAEAATHFIAAPRPSLSRDSMARCSGEQGLLDELDRLLDDIAPSARSEVMVRIAAIREALRAEAAEAPSAEPPSLTYTFH